MPGPVAHHFTARAVASALADRGLISRGILGSASPFLHFGAQGPDFLFFNTRDWPHVDISRGVELFLDVFGFIEDIKLQLVNALPLEEIDELIREGEEESTIIAQTVALLRASWSNVLLLDANIRNAAESIIGSNVASTVFNRVIGHPEQRVDEQYQNKENWWWFDILHYRRTGQFTQALLRRAQAGGNREEMAYALGYLTHFAADVVGHPYINILSGGPYRTHAQRHKVIENYHDTFLYRHYGGNELVQSKLFEQYILGGSEANPELPAHIAQLILDSMQEVYPDFPPPRFGAHPDFENLQGAYRLWFLWFKKSTSVLDGLRPPEPYSLSSELADAFRRFEREMREIADLVSRPFRGGFSILGIFEFLAAAILAMLEFFKALFDFVIGLALTVGLAPFRAALSAMYELGYNLFMTFYEALALSGLAFPFFDMTRNRIVQHFFDPELPDTMGNTGATFRAEYPLKHFWPASMLNNAHLIYPLPPLVGRAALFPERAATNLGPSEYLSSDPVFYLENAGFTVPATYDFLSTLDATGLDVLRRQRFSLNHTLGSARNFSSFLFDRFLSGETIPDFNLDGDRGYGYKSWRLKASTREMPGREEDFPRVNQVEENPDHNIPNSLVNIQ